MLVSEVSSIFQSTRKLSPQNEVPARRMKPLRQSTLNHGRYVRAHLRAWICGVSNCVLLLWSSSELNSSKTAYAHVASWADKYLDSGVSLTMDTAESAGSDYDSDDSRETVHRSYSYVPSDGEVRARAGVSGRIGPRGPLKPP